MKETMEILLGGTGGQGLGIAGVILAQAFAEEEGKNVLEAEAYGISMRGGMSRAEVLVSREEINETRVNNPDVLVALSQPIADIYVPKSEAGAVIILDSLFVEKPANAPAGVHLFASHGRGEEAGYGGGRQHRCPRSHSLAGRHTGPGIAFKRLEEEIRQGSNRPEP